MIERIDFAPLEGITKAVFRRVYQEFFGGADRYFIPFFSPAPEHVMPNRDRRELELESEKNTGSLAIPQVMTRKAADFLWAAELLKNMGYSEVNLNLGCPSGTVTAKGKGAGFLAHPQELDLFLDEIFTKSPLPISIKTRLGIADPQEFGILLELFNQYPVVCLIIHPRVQKQFYKGVVHWEIFAEALKVSKNPVCYNGDLQTVEQIQMFESEFPSVKSVMIGRGAIADPALLRKFHGGPAATRSELIAFTQTLYQAYQEFYGQVRPAAQRMKEVWFYLIHLFEGGGRIDKRLRRSKSPWEYEQLESEIYQTLPLRDHSEGALI